MSILEKIEKLKREYKQNPTDLRVLRELAAAHLRLGEEKEARLWAVRMYDVASSQPECKEALILLAATIPDHVLELVGYSCDEEALEALAGDTDWGGRRAEEFFDPLSELDVMPVLIGQLRYWAVRDEEYDGGLTEEYCQSLVAIGRPAVRRLAELAADQNEDRDVRSWCIDTLGRIGIEAVAAIPVLVGILREEGYRNSSSLALISMGAQGASALIDALDSDDEKIRFGANIALTDLGKRVAKDVSPLIDAIIHGVDEEAIRRAREGLVEIALQVANPIPVLIEALRSGDPEGRSEAAEALARIWPPARDAVPDLVAALSDRSHRVSEAALSALQRIDAASIPESFLRERRIRLAALQDPDGTKQGAIRNAVRSINTEAQEAMSAQVADLIARLLDDDPEVRIAALDALGEMGADAKDAVPILVVVLAQGRDEAIAAARALGRIGAPADDIVPALDTALTGETLGIRIAAAEALGTMGGAAEKAAGNLIRALSVDWELRRASAPMGQTWKDLRRAVCRSLRNIVSPSREAMAAFGKAEAMGLPVIAIGSALVVFVEGHRWSDLDRLSDELLALGVDRVVLDIEGASFGQGGEDAFLSLIRMCEKYSEAGGSSPHLVLQGLTGTPWSQTFRIFDTISDALSAWGMDRELEIQ